MNHLIVCNTPYQIFNSINILANDVEVKHRDCDVLIDESFGAFKDSKKIGMSLLEYALCRHVYYAKRIKCIKSGSKIDTFFYLKKSDHTDEYIFSETKVLDILYDTVWVGDTNYLGSSFIHRNKKCEIIWFEDGLASYAESPRGFGNKVLVEKFIKKLKIGSYSYKPGNLYVNNVLLAKAKDFSVKQLPALSDDGNPARSIVKKIFNYNENESFIKKHDYIYLGQMYDLMNGYTGLSMKKIIQIMRDEGIDVVIRKHPRDRDSFSGVIVDDGTNMWETECIENINDQHVLVACCTTAQLSPKIISGKEPYLVFLYKLFIEHNSVMRNAYDEIVRGVTDMYIDQNKIFVPNNIENFVYIIRKINKKKSLSDGGLYNYNM